MYSFNTNSGFADSSFSIISKERSALCSALRSEVFEENHSDFVNAFFSVIASLNFLDNTERQTFCYCLSMWVADARFPVPTRKVLAYLLDYHRSFENRDNNTHFAELISLKAGKTLCGMYHFFCDLVNSGIIKNVPQNEASWLFLFEIITKLKYTEYDILDEDRYDFCEITDDVLDHEPLKTASIRNVPKVELDEAISSFIKEEGYGYWREKEWSNAYWLSFKWEHLTPLTEGVGLDIFSQDEITTLWIGLTPHKIEEIGKILSYYTIKGADLCRSAVLIYCNYENSFADVSQLHTYVDRFLPLLLQKFLGQKNITEIIQNNHLYDFYERCVHAKNSYDEVFRMFKYVPAYFLWHLNSLNKDLIYFLAAGNNIRAWSQWNENITPAVAHKLGTLPLTVKTDFYLQTAYYMSLGVDTYVIDLLRRIYYQHFRYVETLRPDRYRNTRYFDKEFWAKPAIVFSKYVYDLKQLAMHDKEILLGFIGHCRLDDPNFNFKGRTVASLYRLAINWTEEQSRPKVDSFLQKWQATSLKEWNQLIKGEWYAIIELTNSIELGHESVQLGHCVRTYTTKCKLGLASIWSLRKRKNGEWKSLVTIELNDQHQLIQTKGKYNSDPKRNHLKMILDWVRCNELIR